MFAEERNDTLFIVTDNPLLSIPPESIPPQAIVQPPPYVAPPPPAEDRQKSQKYQEILRDSQPSLRTYPENEKQQQIADRKQTYSQDIYNPYPNIQQYDSCRNIFEHSQQRMSNYEYQRVANYETVHIHNAKNQQLCSPARDVNQQFYTLPTRRPQREVDPPRSVTPDITRGLGHGSLSGMHVIAKQGQRIAENEQARHGSHVDLGRRNMEQQDVRGRYVQSQPQTVVDVKNRLIAFSLSVFLLLVRDRDGIERRSD